MVNGKLYAVGTQWSVVSGQYIAIAMTYVKYHVSKRDISQRKK